MSDNARKVAIYLFHTLRLLLQVSVKEMSSLKQNH